MSKERHEQRLAKWAKQGKQGSEPVRAATVILVRDGESGLETLMLRRNSKIAFGGMWVFPGGRVDPEDRVGLEPDDELGAGRVAAAREAAEEAGLEVGAGEMHPLSHWTPPAITPRRFLTWFFVAAAPEGEVVIDDGEIHEHEWLSPEEALRRRDALEIELAPPTFVTLKTLAQWTRVEEALAAVALRANEFFETRIGVTDDGPVALWHGDAGYEATDAAAAGARHRLSMAKDRWHYERSD
jgi:8-oxo-dGTP pyrophosphatase MutT (NUDIX family)